MKFFRNSRLSRGFILPEILISLALLMLFIMPMLYFLFSIQPLRNISKQSLLHLKEIPEAKRLIENLLATNFENIVDLGGIQELDGVGSCNFIFSRLSAGVGTSSSASLASEISAGIEYQFSSQLSTNTNFPTSIDLISDYGAGAENFLLFIGFNSSSTTDPDILVFDTRDLAAPGLELKQFFLGPGVNNLVLNSKFLVATERSHLTPIWKGDSKVLVEKILEGADIAGASLVTISSTTIDNTFPLSLYLSGGKVAVGSEKNSGREAFVIDVGSGAGDYGAEIGAGVNDLLLKDNLLYIASPKNPELEIYDISSTTAFTPRYFFDAEGSSGNGKSLALQWGGIFLGRTTGNSELINLKSDYLSSRSVAAEFSEVKNFNPNESILSVTPIYGGTLLLLTTNDPTKAIMILKLSDSGASKYEHVLNIPLPAVVEDHICIRNELIAVLKSTSTPVVKIKFP